jgi:hypothetical protein
MLTYFTLLSIGTFFADFRYSLEFPSRIAAVWISLPLGICEMIRLAMLFLAIASLNGLFAFGLIADWRFEIAYLLSLGFSLFGLVTLLSGLFGRSKTHRPDSTLLCGQNSNGVP